MTLENKAGLAVSCIFLGLLGSVIWITRHPDNSLGLSDLPGSESSTRQDRIPAAPEPVSAGKKSSPGSATNGRPPRQQRPTFIDEPPGELPEFKAPNSQSPPAAAAPKSTARPERKHPTGPREDGMASPVPGRFPLDKDNEAPAIQKAANKNTPSSATRSPASRKTGDKKPGDKDKSSPILQVSSAVPASATDDKKVKKDSRPAPPGGNDSFPMIEAEKTDAEKARAEKARAAKAVPVSSAGQQGILPGAQGTSKQGKPSSGQASKDKVPAAPTWGPMESPSTPSPSPASGNNKAGHTSTPSRGMTGTGLPFESEPPAPSKPVTVPEGNRVPAGQATLGGPTTDSKSPTPTGVMIGSIGSGDAPNRSVPPAPVPSDKLSSTSMPSPASMGVASPKPTTPPSTTNGLDSTPGASMPSTFPGSSPQTNGNGLSSSPPSAAPSAPPPPRSLTSPSAGGAVGSAENSTFIPEPTPSVTVPSRSGTAPMPSPPPLPGTPTTQPGARGAAPTMIAGSGGSSSAVPVAADPSRVTVILEKTYQVKAGDSFETLSKRFYGTPAYAQAIRKYLQNDPRSRSSVSQAGQLLHGAAVYVPADAHELAARYADVVPPSSSAPVATTPAPTPPPPARSDFP